MRYDIVDVVNQILQDNSRSSDSIHSENNNESCSFIISLKFFKFLTDEDEYKEKREVEIIRTVTFIDIEGFNSSFTDILLNNKQVSCLNDPKHYSLINFKLLLEAIATHDIKKYGQIKSVLTSLIIEVLKISNSTFFLFGFIEQNDKSVLESTVTLDILSKFMKMSPNFFFEILNDTCQSNLKNEGNENLDEEFHIIDTIFSEIIFFIENTKKEVIFNRNFYYKLKDLSQREKFEILSDHLNKLNFDLQNSVIFPIFNSVILFFGNRSKWKKLRIAHEEILKINSNYKENSVKTVVRNETDELRVIIYLI